ncbi:MAG: U32 family peptidase [Candidatus Onthovivens sp.]|nr:U32 family peptidase [Candidatus Onthovivens sp.]
MNNELLSPAGTITSFYAAISSGANAIYLGIKKFNARAYASNFSLEELKELVKFAHLRNVKIYVTMNTILYDEELIEAFKIIDELALINVDAIIVQDLALLNYITNKYNSLKAHASTQMGIDDIYGAKFLKNIGVSRIVFARETPLDVLKDIKNKLDVEIEVFIHGALCVAYSGNCLMSSMIGERSGNRGKCAGCCRQVYSLIDKTNNKVIKTGYLLSMKDLNISNYINESTFIDSFKIEGRMKEPNYVGGVTYLYRRLLDKEEINQEDFNKVFNRTYTKGFMLNETSENITNVIKPNNFGYEIGKVVKINKDTIWIKLTNKLSKGDQIRIDTNNLYDEVILQVNKLFDANFKEATSLDKIAIISCNHKVDINAKVYKIKDFIFNEKINQILTNKEYKKLPINLIFVAKVQQNLKIQLFFEDYKIEEELDYKVEKSLTYPTTKENIYNQLSKLNDTPYYLNSLEILMDENVFIPIKLINELRRKVVEKLNSLRLDFKVSLKDQKKIKVKSYQLKKPTITVQVSSLKQYEVVKKLGINHIYFNNIVLRNNPSYVNDQEILIGGYGAIEKYHNQNKTLVADYSFNVSNYLDVALLSSFDVDRITLSTEINKEHINNLVNNYFNEFNTYPNLELIVYGRTKLMHTKYCLLKRLGLCGECKNKQFSLKDKFEQFPISFNADCSMNIYNSKIFNILDDVKYLNGINYYRLVFTNESEEEIINIINSFKNILDNKETSKTFDSKTNTRGHFIKSAA